MPVLYLASPGVRLTAEHEHLRVEYPVVGGDSDATLPDHTIPLHEVEQVVIEERSSVSTPALCLCLEQRIPVIILSRKHSVLGLCQAPAPNPMARIAQYANHQNSSLALAIAALCVEAKISNSRRVLQRLAANRESVCVKSVNDDLDAARLGTVQAASLDTLRGYEGTAAGRYFEALAEFFPNSAPFVRRSRRPPLNAANALLSLGYSLLAAEAEALVISSGLDPAIGFLHEPSEGRPSLALDLIEPFRAPVADGLALDLLNHGTLKANEHFVRRDGGVYLETEGRRRFYTSYERRMDREFTSEQTGQRTSLRGELRRMVQSIKNAIVTQEPFVPFFMN